VVGEASLGSEDTPRGDDAVSSRGRRAGLFVLRHRVCARVALRASPPPARSGGRLVPIAGSLFSSRCAADATVAMTQSHTCLVCLPHGSSNSFF
jgi:hypothetical protein